MIGIVALACLALSAAPASAALPGGGFYAGALHPFFAWQHLLLLLGMGLLLGGQSRPSRAPLPLAVGLAAGLALGTTGAVASSAPLPSSAPRSSPEPPSRRRPPSRSR